MISGCIALDAGGGRLAHGLMLEASRNRSKSIGGLSDDHPTGELLAEGQQDDDVISNHYRWRGARRR